NTTKPFITTQWRWNSRRSGVHGTHSTPIPRAPPPGETVLESVIAPLILPLWSLGGCAATGLPTAITPLNATGTAGNRTIARRLRLQLTKVNRIAPVCCIIVLRGDGSTPSHNREQRHLATTASAE